jgi:hypothetical protein
LGSCCCDVCGGVKLTNRAAQKKTEIFILRQTEWRFFICYPRPLLCGATGLGVYFPSCPKLGVFMLTFALYFSLRLGCGPATGVGGMGGGELTICGLAFLFFVFLF